MLSRMVRVSAATHAKLKALAASCGTTMQNMMDAAVEQQRRRRFLEVANASYLRLRADSKAWAGELAERADWDHTAVDGLKEELPYPRPATKTGFRRHRRTQAGARNARTRAR